MASPEDKQMNNKPQYKIPMNSFEGSLALAKVVVDGFPLTPSSDFQIVCQDRIFYVHTLVLSAIPYFAAIIGGQWEESNKRVLHADANPSTMESILAHAYGAKLSYISSIVLKNAGCTTSYGTSCICDPIPVESKQMVAETLGLLDVLIAADYHGLNTFYAAIEDRLYELLPDCWSHPGIFTILRIMLETEALQKFAVSWNLTEELALRLDIFANQLEFAELRADFPLLAAELLEVVLKDIPRYIIPEAQYCGDSDCRRNTKSQVFPERTVCLECHAVRAKGLSRRSNPTWPIKKHASGRYQFDETKEEEWLLQG